MMLLCTRVGLVAFSIDALHNCLLATQCHPMGRLGFHPPHSEADFLLQQETLFDHKDLLQKRNY
jgi:hypothetical protein